MLETLYPFLHLLMEHRTAHSFHPVSRKHFISTNCNLRWSLNIVTVCVCVFCVSDSYTIDKQYWYQYKLNFPFMYHIYIIKLDQDTWNKNSHLKSSISTNMEVGLIIVT